MQNTFKRREIDRSFRKFRDIVHDLFGANFQQWSDMFTHLITHCEQDPVMSIITEPLKNDPRVDAKKWWADAVSSVRGMVGSGYYTLPTDDDERTALLYQVFLGIEYDNYSIQKFDRAVFGNLKYQDMVDTFNDQVVRKFTREIEYRLDEIAADTEGIDEISRESMTVFHHHDRSTTVHGNFQGIAGDVTNSTVNQNLSMTVTAGDFNSLRDYLSSAGLASENIDELEAAIEDDPTPESGGKLGTNVAGWIGKMVALAATGTWQIAAGAACGLLTNAIWAFYEFT